MQPDPLALSGQYHQCTICSSFINVSDQNKKLFSVYTYDDTFRLSTVNRHVSLTLMLAQCTMSKLNSYRRNRHCASPLVASGWLNIKWGRSWFVQTVAGYHQGMVAITMQTIWPLDTLFDRYHTPAQLWLVNETCSKSIFLLSRATFVIVHRQLVRCTHLFLAYNGLLRGVASRLEEI